MALSPSRRMEGRPALWLVLLVLVCASATADEDDEPGIEPSIFERHQTGTHEGGVQYNFVQAEAEAVTQRAQKTDGTSSSLEDTLMRLLKPLSFLSDDGDDADLAEPPMRPSRGKDGSAGTPLQTSLNTLLKNADKRPPAAQRLPVIEPGVPMAYVLEQVRKSMLEASLAEEPRSGVAASSGSGDDYIDQLSFSGLEMLEAELSQKMRRVKSAIARRAGAAPQPDARARRRAGDADAVDRTAADRTAETPQDETAILDLVTEALDYFSAFARSESRERAVRPDAPTHSTADDADGIEGYARWLADEAAAKRRMGAHTDTDTNADTNADANVDTDTDLDADTDTDLDADTDTDWDSSNDGRVEFADAEETTSPEVKYEVSGNLKAAIRKMFGREEGEVEGGPAVIKMTIQTGGEPNQAAAHLNEIIADIQAKLAADARAAAADAAEEEGTDE